MPIDITMPRRSDQMEEATVLRWLKNVRDTVNKGDECVEIETDKATVVYEAEETRVLGQIVVQNGEVAALGAVIGRLLAPGESSPVPAVAPDSPPAPDGASPAPTEPVRKQPAEQPNPHRATPVARKAAAELGVDLGQVGTGVDGRIVRSDVRRAARVEPASPRGIPAEVVDGMSIWMVCEHATA